jgi:proteasome lid subunit RPN8/RPN11
VIGPDDHFEFVTAITQYVKRTKESMCCCADSSALAEERFGDSLAGEWHSHPGAVATISSVDLLHMADDDLEWIVSIWPGKRGWCFRHRVYRKVNGRARIVRIKRAGRLEREGG